MIFVLKLTSGRRRLLRKKMYRSPHERNRQSYFRENRNLNKDFQEEYKNKERILRKRRPKREVMSGFKMSYRYRDLNEENEEEEYDEES